MTTMYVIIEAKWSDDNYDGYWLEDAYYIYGIDLCATEKQAKDKVRYLTKTVHADVAFSEFYVDDFPESELITTFDEDAFDNGRTIGQFVEWCEANGQDYMPALPRLFEYRELNAPNACNKLANKEKDAKIAELEEQNKVLKKELKVLQMKSALKAEQVYTTYVKPGKLLGDKVYEI